MVVGRSIAEDLINLEKKAIFLCSETRQSLAIEERHAWERIVETGEMGSYDVVITTSVLDNGFSVKDKNIEHIVLYTDDRTEFLQELGRVRLSENQHVKVY